MFQTRVVSFGADVDDKQKKVDGLDRIVGFFLSCFETLGV